MPRRASKLQKLSPPSPPQVEPDKHTLFTAWASARGVSIHASISAAALPSRGIGLVTTAPIPSGTRLLFVPEKAIFALSPKQLSQAQLATTSPQAQLVLAALLECEKDAQGVFELWRPTWPTLAELEAGMPMCWPQHLRDLLPSSVRAPLTRQIEDWTRDRDAISSVSARWAEEEVRYLWLIANSRSFHWKPASTSKSKTAKPKPGMMVMCPFIDYMNHAPSGDEGGACKVFQTAGGYEVLAERDYAAGEEIHATYGPHSNDKLLVHYGFVLPSQPPANRIDDEIRLDHLLLPLLPQQQLQDVGFLAPYSLLPATNELCFKTHVAVRAVLLTSNEWEYYALNGEDLSEDRTRDVEAWVGREVLGKLREEARARLEELGGVERLGWEVAVMLLTVRWRQIVDAMDVFLAE